MIRFTRVLCVSHKNFDVTKECFSIFLHKVQSSSKSNLFLSLSWHCRRTHLTLWSLSFIYAFYATTLRLEIILIINAVRQCDKTITFHKATIEHCFPHHIYCCSFSLGFFSVFKLHFSYHNREKTLQIISFSVASSATWHSILKRIFACRDENKSFRLSWDDSFHGGGFRLHATLKVRRHSPLNHKYLNFLNGRPNVLISPLEWNEKLKNAIKHKLKNSSHQLLVPATTCGSNYSSARSPQIIQFWESTDSEKSSDNSLNKRWCCLWTLTTPARTKCNVDAKKKANVSEKRRDKISHLKRIVITTRKRKYWWSPEVFRAARLRRFAIFRHS